MLFLPALLFFLLGTGTSALETGSNDHTLTLPIREGMEDDKIYKRAQGYWQPAVRTKHGSFHVTCEKLTLDRTGLVSRVLLWYISTRANRWCLAPPIQTKSILHAMGSVFLCGYWVKKSTVSVYRDLKTFTFDWSFIERYWCWVSSWRFSEYPRSIWTWQINDYAFSPGGQNASGGGEAPSFADYLNGEIHWHRPQIGGRLLATRGSY